MAGTINTNLDALRIRGAAMRSQGNLAGAVARLSSGLRIGSARDDAAGLAIADRFTAQVRGMSQAARNANDAISLAQTAQGGLSSASSIMQRMRELAVQSANGTHSAGDRAALQQELAQLGNELERIATETQFNGRSVLDGSMKNAAFQVGAQPDQSVAFSISSARPSELGAYTLTTASGAGTIRAPSAPARVGINPVFTPNRVDAQTLTIDSTGGSSASVSVGAGASASDIAAAINAQAATTGVTASAKTSADMAWFMSVGLISFELAGRNPTSSPVTITANVTLSLDFTPLADAINAQSAITGITATVVDEDWPRLGIHLESAEGHDIKINRYRVNGVAGPGQSVRIYDDYDAGVYTELSHAFLAGSTTVGGTVSLSSTKSYTVTSSVATNRLFAQQSSKASDETLAGIDILSASSASRALRILDSALETLNGGRAALGAIENRFAAAVENLRATAENLGAAHGRIVDADFAAETATLTRSRVLQDASTAVLAQANAAPHAVLSLLRGTS